MLSDLPLQLGILIAEAAGGGAAPGAGGGAARPEGPPVWPIFLIMFAMFYFLMIRPQRKREQEHRSMIDQLKEKDRVVTAGGIHGQVVAIKEKDVVLRVDDRKDIQIKVLRTSVVGVRGPDGEEPATPAGPLNEQQS